MPNEWTPSFEGLIKCSDRVIDPCEHPYLKVLAEADQIDVWLIKDILDRCVCYALSDGFTIIMLDIIMTEESKKQDVPVPWETRLNLLGDAPDKKPPYEGIHHG